MTWSLYDAHGRRKYLVPAERAEFIRAAFARGGKEGAFCAVLAFCGPRISETLNLTPFRIDDGAEAINFETLKRRKRGIIRAVPVPRELLDFLDNVLGYRALQRETGTETQRLFPWSRTTGWKIVREVMHQADVPRFLWKPKALRHAFGIHTSAERITPGLVQLWMGHARLETTMIYATPIGEEARALAMLTWKHVLKDFGSGARTP
jgi:integrase/recombinase XerD